MYSLKYPQEILFGAQSAFTLEKRLREQGFQRPLLCVSRSVMNDTVGSGKAVVDSLSAVAVGCLSDMSPEVPLSALQDWLDQARELSPDIVIAIGGGSVIDAAKVLASVIPTHFSISSLYHGRDMIQTKGLPFWALSTTAGTGAEVTKNSVLLDEETGQKQSVRHDTMLPDLACVDPCLTLGCPASISIYSGLDAWVQAVESYYSKNANTLTQTLALKAMAMMLDALPQLPENLQNISIRSMLAEASLFSGMAFAQSGLGAVHAFAHPLGGHFHIPHGEVCAMLLLPVMKLNATDTSALEQALNLKESLIDTIESLLQKLNIQSDFSRFGVTQEAIPFILQHCRSNSMKSNPRELSDEEITQFFQTLLS